MDISDLEADAARLIFPEFTETTALRLGQLLVSLAQQDNLPVVIDIRTPDRTLFHGHSFTANPLGCAAALASLTLREDNGLAPLLQWRPLARVGETSYGIYLYHLITLHVANLVLGRLGVDSVWAVAIVYALLSVADLRRAAAALMACLDLVTQRISRSCSYLRPDGGECQAKAEIGPPAG